MSKTALPIVPLIAASALGFWLVNRNVKRRNSRRPPSAPGPEPLVYMGCPILVTRDDAVGGYNWAAGCEGVEGLGFEWNEYLAVTAAKKWIDAAVPA